MDGALGRALGKDPAWHGPLLGGCWPGTAQQWLGAADLDGDILRVGVHSLPAGDRLRV